MTKSQLTLFYYCPIHLYSKPLSSSGWGRILHGAQSLDPLVKSSRLCGKSLEERSFAGGEKGGGCSKNSTQTGSHQWRGTKQLFFQNERENYVGGSRAAMQRQLVPTLKWRKEREAIIAICKNEKAEWSLSQPQNPLMIFHSIPYCSLLSFNTHYTLVLFSTWSPPPVPEQSW